MDNLTHSLVGAVMGQAGLKKTTGLAMPALIIGANLPDVDAACFIWLHGTEHLAFRRGITHGPPALVLLPLILAGLLWGFDRWQTKRGTRPEGRLPVRFGWLYAMAFVGCLSHPFFDWLNVYGIRLLEPFSSQWFYGDTLFIIDPWLWAMLIASIWISRRREKAGGAWMRPAQVGLAAMLAYIGVNGAWSYLVLQNLRSTKGLERLDTQQIIVSPRPLIPWSREILVRDGGEWLVGKEPNSPWNTKLMPDFFAKLAEDQCEQETIAKTPANTAFLFWSRAPFLTRAPDGSVVLRDARFTDPRVGDRFALALPDVKCEELPSP